VNAFGGYGYFRDELYYLACSNHLAAGYVDHPPLSILVLALGRLLLGDSILAIRLIPAIASALCVLIVCLMVRRMGGGRLATVIAALAFVASGQLLAFFTFYSMNSLDILLWTLAAYVLLRLAERPTPRGWMVLGIVLGLGLLNKTSVLWLGAGVAVGLLATGLRSELKTRWPYLAAALALLLFSPYLIWNLIHDLAHFEFMQNAVALKYSSLTRLRFVLDQLVNMNPPTMLVALAGLAWYLFSKEGRRFRILGIVFLTAFGILLLNPHSKSEYLAAAYPPLFAGGGLLFARLTHGRWRTASRGLAGLLIALLVAFGVVVAPLAMPILPVADYVRYLRALGVSPTTAEDKALAELPQFFADMHGWEDLAREVSAVYLSIPEAERATTVAFVGNYGEAGALELFARDYPLPRVISAHNSYWVWGVGSPSPTTFIRLGGSREDYLESYGEVLAAGRHLCRYCMPYQGDLGIFVARQRRVPIEQAWPEYKHYE
ncbi:MAG: glycosyltransferase family 39 protein, partial [Vicinamibacteria bacterium]|nr:glycosyltransferase family 39 protein [Vicinamibacteria bacterium]